MSSEPWKIFCFDEVTSTIDTAKKTAQNATSKFIVIAESQTKGRGQYGRTWESPPGKNLLSTFSVNSSECTSSELISILAGVSVAETLADLGLNVKCKWPNDILVNNSKIAGILIEKESLWYYIGVGLNVLWPEVRTPYKNNVSRTSIKAETQLKLNKKTIVKKIAESLDFWMGKTYTEVFEKYNSFWNDKDKIVKVNINGNFIPGKLVSILNNGGVKVKLNTDEMVEIYSSAQLNYEY